MTSSGSAPVLTPQHAATADIDIDQPAITTRFARTALFFYTLAPSFM